MCTGGGRAEGGGHHQSHSYCYTATHSCCWCYGSLSRTLSELHHNDAGVECPCYYVLITAVNDLCDVLAVIHDLNDWKELGLQLGLLYPSLERIDREQRGRISGCKIDMLSAWLEQQDNVSQRGVPSWTVLRAALEMIGENEIANRIAVSGYNY